MRFLPEQLAGLPESSDRRARARRNPSEVTCLELGESNRGIVLNVSETGLAIAVAQSIIEDHIPRLSFRLPQLDRTFLAEGEIVWRSESQKSAGVRFVNLEERDRVQIRNWIRAEIVSMEFETAVDVPPAMVANAVLIMPSPRKAVATWAQSEAERDEARAAEFDRMFPSEATLALQAHRAAEILEPEFNFLAETSEAEDVEIAAEAFHAAQEEHHAGDEMDVSEAALGELAANGSEDLESAEEKTAAEIDWREKWELFHQERENLERSRSQETILELPAPFSTPLPEAPAEISADLTPVTAANDRNWPAPVADRTFGSSNISHVATARETVASAGAASAVAPVDAHGTDDRTFAAPTVTTAVADASDEKNPLSIAALCVVLVAMCFILGYAIQPGAFRFETAKSADTPAETVSPEASRGAEVPAAATSAPPAEATSTEQNLTAAAPTVNPMPGDAPAAAKKEEPVSAALKTSALATDALGTDPTRPTSSDSSAVVPLASATSGARAIAPDVSATKAAVAPAATPTAPGSAGPTAPATAHESVIPVSFFPVTAPSEGAPSKLMQLPEETITETPSIVVHSHQFLFVPALPGQESEHPLERVHLGDRVVKVDPTYPAQALEKMQGGSVHLRTTIGRDGIVVDVQPISGPTNLIPAAVSAVRQWRYKPTDIDGKPIAIEEDIVIEFRPRREVAAR
jgi:TonB family protein